MGSRVRESVESKKRGKREFWPDCPHDASQIYWFV
jgi:hypothetical protein